MHLIYYKAVSRIRHLSSISLLVATMRNTATRYKLESAVCCHKTTGL